MRFNLRCTIVSCLIFPINIAWAAPSILILTSYPESFYSPITQAFNQQYPDITLRVLNKKTPALITHVVSKRSPTADLVWLSSSDAMAQLHTQQYIDEPSTFAWSQFGFLWHQDKLKSHNLSPPEKWEDLLKPEFANQVALSAPSRSGTNHLLIELVLQQYGWESGWALLNQLGGNIATITARSFGVREGILKQRFITAPVVDFFYKSALAQGHNVGFKPLPYTPLIPAQIATLKSHGGNPSALKFIQFLTSTEGQSLMESPHVGRIPLNVGRQITQQQSLPPFDANLSAQRYHTVNVLFDFIVTQRLPQLQEFWQQWAQLNNQPLTEEEERYLQSAVQIIIKAPVDESVASDPTLNQKLSPPFKYEHFYQRVTKGWEAELNAQLEQAYQQLEYVIALRRGV
ncbi:extracellular solute-binding protein [Vibrio lamellibrachiae]|uniref:ABC transporter substrate-binding protein n=1 Tax=Vibrio lamellibrachiae TaxID=2910253 RepID=UPI003D0DC623